MTSRSTSTDCGAGEMWERFIAHLNAVDPLIFKRGEPPLPHKSFLGSIDSYRVIFIAANSQRGAGR